MWTMNHRMMLKVSPILINPQRDHHTAASSFIASCSSVLLFCFGVFLRRSGSATFSSKNQQYTNTLNSHQQVNSWWLHAEDQGGTYFCVPAGGEQTQAKRWATFGILIGVTTRTWQQINNLVSLLVSGLSSALAIKLCDVCLNKI